VVKVDGAQHERRFPAGTDLATIERWRRNTVSRIDLDLALPSSTPVPTLSQDIATYLALLPEGDYKRDTEILLRHWARTHGDAPRSALTAQVIHAQLLAWHRDGAAPVTCNHRRRVLVTLWRTLDGPEAPNPAKTCQKLAVPRPETRGFTEDTIAAIFGAMRPSATKIRLQVLAATGFSHAMLMRLTPEDLHLDVSPPHVILRPRRKGLGVTGKAVPLTRAAVKALRQFAKRKLWGSFSQSSMRKTFRVAATKVGAVGYPYLLRHSFGARAYAATRDLRAVSELLQHSDLRTTKRYAEMAVSDTMLAAVRALNQRARKKR
jgi:integrase